MAECNCRGKCATCPCAKAKDPCTDACHKGSPNESCINFQEALQVKAMSVSEIRKALASYGLSPIGDKSELMPRLAHHLRNQKGDSAVKEETPSAGAGGGNAKTLIDDIIRYQDEHAILLSLAGVPITSASSVAAMRKAYLKLSLKIHPDKHDSSAESKAAFQALVNAFDTLSNPEEEDDDVPSGKRKKAERVERSNDNCYETHIYCPKCHIPWNTPDLGLEKGAYNFFMMGIKQYGCGGCLLRFGCVTAVHHCPLCDKEFDYDPSDYHRQINCGNAKCTGKFGFWYHPVSALRERRIRSEVKAEQEKEHKRRNQRIRRAGRAKDRAPAHTVESSLKTDEQLFVKGLSATCPRCGTDIADIVQSHATGDEERLGSDAASHLDKCSDIEKIQAYALAKDAQKKQKEKDKHRQAVEADSTTLKAWELNGKQVGQLWMLTKPLLRNQLLAAGLTYEDKEDETELISRLATHLRSKKPLLITSGPYKDTGEQPLIGNDLGYDTSGIAGVDQEDLPANMATMEVDELKAVCASYGVKFTKKATKSQLIKQIELARYKNDKQMKLMLTNKNADGTLRLTAADDNKTSTATAKAKAKAPAKKSQAKRKRKIVHEDGSESDSSGNEDWVPQEEN